jgi:hypothetical protein
MATIGRFVELLREESAAAEAEGELDAGVRLYELAEDPGDMSDEQERWIAQASDEELQRYIQQLRRGRDGDA